MQSFRIVSYAFRQSFLSVSFSFYAIVLLRFQGNKKRPLTDCSARGHVFLFCCWSLGHSPVPRLDRLPLVLPPASIDHCHAVGTQATHPSLVSVMDVPLQHHLFTAAEGAWLQFFVLFDFKTLDVHGSHLLRILTRYNHSRLPPVRSTQPLVSSCA